MSWTGEIVHLVGCLQVTCVHHILGFTDIENKLWFCSIFLNSKVTQSSEIMHVYYHGFLKIETNK